MQTDKVRPQVKVLAGTIASKSLLRCNRSRRGPACLGKCSAIVILKFFMLSEQRAHIFNLRCGLQMMPLVLHLKVD